jgi:hypothetical protein
LKNLLAKTQRKRPLSKRVLLLNSEWIASAIAVAAAVAEGAIGEEMLVHRLPPSRHNQSQKDPR